MVDLCPVGSLLSKDFLHKARAWELDKTPSVCTGCSQGCNVTLDTRDNTVVRVRPRPNLEVNRYFMCDHGRANYRWMNRGDRIEAPLVRMNGDAGGHRLGYRAGSRARAGARRRAAARSTLASPRASTEALYLARRLLSRFDWTGGVSRS